MRLLEQGKSSRTIASVVGVGKSKVNDFLTKYRSGYGLKDNHPIGRPLKTTVRVDKIIKRKSTADPKKTASDIVRELKQGNHVKVSRRAVSRHLNDVGLVLGSGIF